jgi:small subunit ribosomal protein S1
MSNPEETQVPEEGKEAPTEPAAPGISMDQLLVESYDLPTSKVGDILDGTIVSITPSEITVDVGAKSEGIIAGRELERLGMEITSELKVGDQIVTFVVRPEDKDGHIVLSLARAQQERDWREAERLHQTQEVFEATVAGFNRGGLVVRMGKVRGFVPASQLVSARPMDDAAPAPAEVAENVEAAEGAATAESAAASEQRWAHMVGQKLQLKVIEIDRRRNRLILSERLAVRDWRKEQKERLLGSLQRGDTRKGTVTSLQSFGAFIDLGGADGLIHLSELSWGRVTHPREVLEVGQEVEVYVLNVDRDKRRIGLSLRRLQAEPWSVVTQKYKVGQVVEGTITKLANFGAFARIDSGIEGLIHISELAKHRVNHPKEVVKEGDTLQLRVIRIDPSRRRMGLSLKRVADEDYAEYDWQEADEEMGGPGEGEANADFEDTAEQSEER